MKRLAAIVIGATLIGGCAAPYQLSEATVKASATMTKEAALQIVQNQLLPTDRQLGMCSHQIYPRIDRAGDFTLQPAQMTGQTIKLTYLESETPANVNQIIGTTLARAGATRTEVQRYYYLLTFDVTKLARVFIGDSARIASCKGKSGDMLVELHNKEPVMGTHQLGFQIAQENLDMFLAAIKTLSPNAPITSSAS
jgi:hypothetical protein